MGLRAQGLAQKYRGLSYAGQVQSVESASARSSGSYLETGRKGVNLMRDAIHRKFRIPLILMMTMLLVSLGAAGCASMKNQIADLRLDSASYETVFDATLAALRSSGFRLDRVDRRFGVITTQPLEAGSVLEPWRDLRATPSQAVQSTLNYERRVFRVMFARASGSPPHGANGGGAGGVSPDVREVLAQVEPVDESVRTESEIANFDGTIRIDVQCVIERAHRPGRRIESTSTRRVSYTVDPSLAKRGIPGQFWEPISRDPYLEQDLMKRIATGAPNEVEVEFVEQGRAGEG